MDHLSKEKRSWNMSRIRSTETKPEERVRKYLFSKGFRYRKNDKRLPGKPDIVLPKYRAVIFINGCFWHCHKGCSRANVPKSNLEYWKVKLENNVNIYNDKDDKSNTWWPVYFGPAVTEFDSWAFKFYREYGKFTQKQVADAVGTSVRTYQKWESGDSIPDGYFLIRLMNFLDINSVQEFIKNEPIPAGNIRVQVRIDD